MADDKTHRYSLWLADAMRAAGLDIDSHRGGGRAELAERLGVARSTIARWLDGVGLPGLQNLDGIAEALGTTVDAMLVESGLVRPERMSSAERPVAPRFYDPGETLPEHLDLADLAQRLGYRPDEAESFVAVVETTMQALRERRLRALGLPLDTPRQEQ